MYTYFLYEIDKFNTTDMKRRAEIQRMVKDAEANAGEDKKRRAHIEAKNHGESLVHATEKNLKEHGDKIGARQCRNHTNA